MHLYLFLHKFAQNEGFYCALSLTTFSFQVPLLLKNEPFTQISTTLGVVFPLLIILSEIFYLFEVEYDRKKRIKVFLFLMFISLAFHLYLSLFLIEGEHMCFELFLILFEADKLLKGFPLLKIMERLGVFILFIVKFSFFSRDLICSTMYLSILILLLFRLVIQEKNKNFRKNQNKGKSSETLKASKNVEIETNFEIKEIKDFKENPYLILNSFKEAIILFDATLGIKWHNDFLFRIMDLPKGSCDLELEFIRTYILNMEQEGSPKIQSFKTQEKVRQAFQAFHTRVESIAMAENDDSDLMSPGLIGVFMKSPLKSSILSSSFSKILDVDSKRNFKGKKAHFLNENGYFENKDSLMGQDQKKYLKDFLREIFVSMSATLKDFNDEGNDFNLYGSIKNPSDSMKRTFFVSVYPCNGEVFVCLRPLNKNDLVLELHNNYVIQSKQLASMCHELRTPLNSVTSLLEMMQSEIDSPKKIMKFNHYEYLAAAIMNSKLLLSSINDFLDFFSITSQLFSLENQKINTQKFFHEITELFRPFAEKKGLSLILNIEKGLPILIYTDDKRLRQIILNLMSNSIRFTQEGVVSLQVKEKAKDFLEITITDTGSGIESGDLKQLANFHAREGNKSKTTGGFGLFIANHLANYLGPTLKESQRAGVFKGLKVKTEVGRGTKFTFLVKNQKSEIEANEESLASIEDPHPGLYHHSVKQTFEKLHRNSYKFITKTEILKDKLTNPILDCIQPLHSDSDPTLKNILSARIPLNKTSMPTIKKLHGSRSTVNFHENQSLQWNELNTNVCKCSKVLAVDDNEFNLFVLTEMFKKRNTSIDVAHSGVESIKMIQGILQRNDKFCKKCKFYRLILMDIDMPVKNGIETTDELKKIFKEHGLDVPIIALSAFSQQDMKDKAKEVGIVSYIEKPFPKEKIDAVLAEYL